MSHDIPNNALIIVADGGKLGEAHLGVIGPLDRFEALITADADAEQVAALRRAGLEVVEAELPDDGPGPAGAADDLAG